MTSLTAERLAEIRGYVASDHTCNLTARVRTDLADLLAELDATTGDLAVAVQVAGERGTEVERLRDAIAAYIAAEYDTSTLGLERRSLAFSGLLRAVPSWREGQR